MMLATIVMQYHVEFPDWVMAALLLLVLLPIAAVFWIGRK